MDLWEHQVPLDDAPLNNVEKPHLHLPPSTCCQEPPEQHNSFSRKESHHGDLHLSSAMFLSFTTGFQLTYRASTHTAGTQGSGDFPKGDRAIMSLAAHWPLIARCCHFLIPSTHNAGLAAHPRGPET